MIFRCARIKTDSLKIPLGKSRIKQVPFTKFLAVIIDDKLYFDNHLSYIIEGDNNESAIEILDYEL